MELERTREVHNGRLWFATLGGAIAWALHLVLSYPLVGVTCRVGSLLALVLVSVGTAVVCAASLGVSWYESRRLAEPRTDAERRGHFMARFGFWSGVYFLFVIILESLPVFMNDPCQDFRLPVHVGLLTRGAGLLLLGFFPNTALAHVPDGPLRPEDVFSSWSLDPFILLALVVGAGGYVRGLRALWRRAGRGRGVTRGQAGAFAAGMVALALALLSPLDTVGAVLFSAHMLQHLVLMLVAAPLLALGLPGYTLLWALPLRTRRGLARAWRSRWLHPVLHVLGTPLAVVVLHSAAVWAWHLPDLYTAALVSEPVHALEHASFLGSALLFWWRVRASAGSGSALLTVFATSMQSGLLGVLIIFAPSAWYPVQARGADGWGLTMLEDQQLAGLLMWVPGSLVYLGAMLALTLAWLRAAERRAPRRAGAREDAPSLPVDARRPAARAVPPVLCLGVLALAMLGTGCRESARASTVTAASRLEGTGGEGLYRFDLELRPASPSVGELFEVRTTLRDARTSQPVSGARVVVDATMPEHEHGMVTAPEHTELGEGHYLSRGMKLHMPGRWRFHVRVEHGGREDTLDLDYEQPPRALP